MNVDHIAKVIPSRRPTWTWETVGYHAGCNVALLWSVCAIIDTFLQNGSNECVVRPRLGVTAPDTLFFSTTPEDESHEADARHIQTLVTKRGWKFLIQILVLLMLLSTATLQA